MHGSVYYFGRNDALNANNWFNTNTVPEIPIGELRRNDFGGTIGGPVVKDKLFFFFSQEFNREIDGDLHTGQTPSAAELSGDFTGASTGGHLTNCYYNASAPQFGVVDFPVSDPATGTPCGPAVVNSFLTNQNISSTVEGFSPAGKLITQLYPAANVTPTAANPCPNPDYKQILKSPVNLWQIFARGDYYLNKSTRFDAHIYPVALGPAHAQHSGRRVGRHWVPCGRFLMGAALEDRGDSTYNNAWTYSGQ